MILFAIIIIITRFYFSQYSTDYPTYFGIGARSASLKNMEENVYLSFLNRVFF